MRRPQPFQQSEITDLSFAIIARLVRVKEKLVSLHESSIVFLPLRPGHGEGQLQATS